jgi:hypothetical protein
MFSPSQPTIFAAKTAVVDNFANADRSGHGKRREGGWGIGTAITFVAAIGVSAWFGAPATEQSSRQALSGCRVRYPAEASRMVELATCENDVLLRHYLEASRADLGPNSRQGDLLVSLSQMRLTLAGQVRSGVISPGAYRLVLDRAEADAAHAGEAPATVNFPASTIPGRVSGSPASNLKYEAALTGMAAAAGDMTAPVVTSVPIAARLQ